DENPVAVAEGVVVDLERVATVFELVARRVLLGRELPRLAHERDAGTEAVRHGRPDDEPPRFDAEHHVGTATVALDEAVDHRPEGRSVGEERGDVLEDDAGLREVGDVADPGPEIDHRPFCTTSPRRDAAVPSGSGGRKKSGFRATLSLRISK